MITYPNSRGRMQVLGMENHLLFLTSFWIIIAIHNSNGNPWNTDCPKKCICELRQSKNILPTKTFYHTVDCSNSKLSEIPANIPESTEILLLRGNVIQSVHRDLPRFQMIKEVDLSHNNIATLGFDPMFINLTGLQYLNLEYNKLQTLLQGSFSGLQNVNVLLLSHNEIDLIEERTFDDLIHIRKLSLSGNKLLTLKASWLRTFTELHELNLDYNGIQRIENNSFAFLSTLADLSLVGNSLKALDKLTFNGLSKLQTLRLDKNRLTAVPTKSLSIFKKLRLFTMNNNPISQLRRWSFKDLSIIQITLNDMKELITVDQEAFFNMNDLVIAEMHDNPKFSYLDSGAFINVPKLQRLYVHNNNLMAISSEMTDRLPSLQEISFYNNPIHCDCNAFWIKLTISNSSYTNNSFQNGRIHFLDADKLTCDTPLEMNMRPLDEIPMHFIFPYCPPTIIPYFNDSYQKELGDSITYECRAIGKPTPHIHWILANGKAVNNTSNYSRFKLEGKGTLSLKHIKATDAGPYTCIAENKVGFDRSSTVMQVHSKNIHILHKGIATNFITVTWNGTDATVFTSDYVILYKKSGSDDEYGKIHLRPYMRTYTITNLLPETMYEFCIAYEHSNEIVKLNCLNIKTKHEMYVMEGVKTLDNSIILIALTVCVSFIIFTCVGVVLIKRYRRRKAYKEPEGANYKIETMSQIPLDNLYNPPSTPLCTSRTTLISTTSSNA